MSEMPSTHQGINQPVTVQSAGFDPEFLAKYSKAKYDAILAASEEACRNGFTAPQRQPGNSTQSAHVSARTASAGLSANTAARVQPATSKPAAGAERSPDQIAPAEHAGPPSGQSAAEPAPHRASTEPRRASTEPESQSQSHDANMGKARRKATEQVETECNISAAPTDTGYRHLYDLEISRRTQKILRSLSKRTKQRENRSKSKEEEKNS